MVEAAKVLPFPTRNRAATVLEDEKSANDTPGPDIQAELLRRGSGVDGSASATDEEFADKLEQLFDKLLQQGLIQVFLDPRVNGVHVPERFKRDSVLVLNFSKNFSPGDVAAGKTHVSQTLTFDKVPFLCKVPYISMMAVLQPLSHTALIFSDKALQYLGPETYERLAQPRLVPVNKEKEDAEEHEAHDPE